MGIFRQVCLVSIRSLSPLSLLSLWTEIIPTCWQLYWQCDMYKSFCCTSWDLGQNVSLSQTVLNNGKDATNKNTNHFIESHTLYAHGSITSTVYFLPFIRLFVWAIYQRRLTQSECFCVKWFNSIPLKNICCGLLRSLV